jgi:hypothetical protein
MTLPTISKLLNEREVEYGKAWKLTGLMMVPARSLYHNLLSDYPAYAYPWVAILCKLCRALVSPTKVDHWRDIAGYAQLVIYDLTKEKEQ